MKRRNFIKTTASIPLLPALTHQKSTTVGEKEWSIQTGTRDYKPGKYNRFTVNHIHRVPQSDSVLHVLPMGGIHCINPSTGETQWSRFQTSKDWMPHRNTLYHINYENELTALDIHTGNEHWRLEPIHTMRIFHDTLYLDQSNQSIAVDPETANQLWSHRDIRRGFLTSRATQQTEPQYIYVNTNTHDIEALDPYTGETVWTRDIEWGDAEVSEVVESNDSTYIRPEYIDDLERSDIICLDTHTGEEKWSLQERHKAINVIDQPGEHVYLYIREPTQTQIKRTLTEINPDTGGETWSVDFAPLYLDEIPSSKDPAPLMSWDQIELHSDSDNRLYYAIYNTLCTSKLIHGCLDPATGEKLWSIDHGETTTTNVRGTDIYTRNDSIHRRIDIETAETHWIVDLDRPMHRDSEFQQIGDHLITSNRPHLESRKIHAT